MPRGQAPKSKKVSKFDGDYVGTYDGSKDKFMTRRVTGTKEGTVKKMVPNSSKPTEAIKSLKKTKGNDAFDSARYERKRKAVQKGGFGYIPGDR